MGVIAVPGQSGRTYSVKIAGDAPTPEEQSRIDAYISQQEAGSPFYNPPSQTAPAEEEGGFFSGLGTAVGVGVDQLQQGYGSALEGIGSLLGTEGLQRYGKETAEFNEAQAAEGAQKLTGRDDVNGLGSAVSYFGETLAQQLPQVGISMAGGAAGAQIGGAAGAAFGGIGAVPGAIIGGIIGGAAANLPYFYGQNRERQKEAIDRGLKVEVDEGAAMLAAVPQAALDAIVDRFMIGKFLSPAALRSGGLFTRAVKGGAAGIVTEVPTEVGQQIIERMQAGLPLDDEEAIREYEDAAIAAGLVGGTVGGLSSASAGDIRKKKEAERASKVQAELDQDLLELAAEADQRKTFGLAALNQPVAPEAGAGQVAQTLALPSPKGLTPSAPPAPEAVAPSPAPPKTYGQGEYDAAVQKAASLGRFSAPAIQNAIAKETGTKVPMSRVREIRDDMERTGILIPDKGVTGGFRIGKVPENNFSMEASLRETMVNLQQSIEADTAAREKALLDTRRLQQTGGTSKQIREVASLSDALAAKIAKAQETQKEIAKRLTTVAKDTAVPKVERPASPIAGTSVVAPITEVGPEAQQKAVADRVAAMKAAVAQREERKKATLAQIKKIEAEKRRGPLPTEFARQLDAMKASVAEDTYAISDLKDRIKDPAPAIAAERRAMEAEALRQQAAKAAQVAKTPVYTAQQQKVFGALRKRMNNLGLADVRLTAEKVIRPDLAQQGNLIEGSFDVQDGNRLIALALSIYDPKMTDQELFDALSEVMNHEVIHAMKNMGLFTEKEWKILSDLSRQQRYMKKARGKQIERNYSYFDRAKRMYANDGPEIQTEEAIAEMFRDYVAGRLKIGGKPRSLMERIKGFFRSLWKSHEDVGLTDANAIFEGVRFGKIGARERKATQPTGPAARTSEVTDLGQKREEKKLQTFHKGLMGDVQDRANAMREVTAKAIEDGVFEGYEVGDILKGKIAPMKITGRYMRRWRPNTTTLMHFDRMGAKPTIVEQDGVQYIPMLRYTSGSEQSGDAQEGELYLDMVKSAGYPKMGGLQSVERFSSINSKEFKEWFGNSRVVDSTDGDPVPVFHGTRFGGEIAEFKPMTHFGTASAANARINATRVWNDQIEDEAIYPLYVRMENPLHVGRETEVWRDDADMIRQIASVLSNLAFDDVRLEDDGTAIGPNKQLQDAASKFRTLANLLVAEEVTADEGRLIAADLLTELGYDGITYSNVIEDPGSVSYVVAFPEQVKSVFNKGTFDKFSKDIRYSALPSIRDDASPEIQRSMDLAEDAVLRYSKTPSIKPILAPVKNKDGKETYIYGVVMDGNRPMHVFLPEGEHTDIGTGNGTGFGMAHIKARAHDREITTYTKFPSAEQAMFNMLKVWQQQGYKDGAKITASKTEDGYDLRWNDGLTHGSPPLRMGLWRHPSGLPIMYVKTFFPELPVNNRLAAKKSSMEQKGVNDATNQTGTGNKPTRNSTIPASAGDRAGRHQGGSLAPLAGAPLVTGASGPDPRLIAVAEDYARKIGVRLKRQDQYMRVDEDRAKRIAAAYDAMPHAPEDPAVQEAYKDLISQTMDQYRALVDAGYEFTFFDDATDPYAGNPWNAMRDLRKNKKMAVYGTYVGFGTEGVTAVPKEVLASPMLADTGIKWKDQKGEERTVYANDLFRAVHDAFGHGLEGAGFRADGEENAWQAHVRLFTGKAVAALTSETRGQNSWLNFGPYGEQNRTAKVEDTIFAEQKIGLMPDWTWQEGRAGDMSYGSERRASMLSIRPSITPQVGKQIGKAQAGLMYTRSADLIAKILNLKGRGLRQDKARRIADGILRRFQDNMLPVGRMVQELSAAGLTITDAMDPYLQEELMHGVVGHRIADNQKNLFTPVVNAIKRIDVKALDLDRLKRASDDAAKDGKGFASYMLNDTDSPRTALADIYLYARHAKERNKFIREVRDPENKAGSGMTDAEADAILQWFNRATGENAKAFADLEVGIKAIVADTNKTRLDAGLISQDVIDKSRWNNYVPLRGIYDPDGDLIDAMEEYAGPPGRPRLGARGKEDPMVKGRFDYASDLVANIFTQNQNAILRAERNKVGQSFLNLLRSDTDRTSDYATILDRRPMTRAVNAQGKNVDVVDFQAIRAPDMLTVKENGREVFVRFKDVRLAGALNGQNGMSPANANFLVSAMSKVNRYLASISTSYNPEFMVTNMFRDLQTAGVNVNQFEKDGITKDVLGGLKGALMGIRRSIRKEDDSSPWSKVYQDFVAAGGQNATNQFNSLSEEMAGIKRMLGDVADAGIHGKWNAVKHGIIGRGAGSLLQLVEDYNTVIENGIRVATYKALLDRGFTRERAAQAARNVTVNFAKGGDYRQFMNAFYLFYNASLQGSFALLNAAVRSSKVRKIWGSVIAVGILQDQLNAALSDDDDDGEKVYDKIPSYVLEHNLILPDPFGLTDRSYISIPMPYGLNMAVNAGRSMSRAARGAYDPSEAATSIFGTLIDTLNPIGGAESFANFAAPTVVDPFIDLVENEDFANKPIYKENLVFDRTPTPDSQMFWSTTSPSAIWIAKNLNELTGGNAVRSGFADISPDVMEFWFEFLTGGVGRFVQRGVELPANVAEDGLGDDLIRNIPFVRKAVGSVSQTEDMGAYIERASRVLMAGEEYKQAKETGNTEWLQDTKDRYPEELKVLPRVKAFEAMLRKISKQMNAIEKNPRMPESQKKALTEKLKERKQQVLAAANRLLIDM